MLLTIGWYFHVPPCASDLEVRHVVNESLRLLVDAHRQAHAKVSIALTGCLLERMCRDHADCIATLASAASDGIVDLLATTYYEVCPLLIPTRYLQQQVELDLAIKERLFDVRPVGFWPGNFAWTPSLPNILTKLGLRAAIVDEVHLREAHQTQLWHWLRTDELQMETQLVDTLMNESPSRRVYHLQQASGLSLCLRVQSTVVRRDLSFGTTGAIHHPWDDKPLDEFVARLLESGCESTFLFSGDDGDRINPVSIHQYRRLLHRVGPELGSMGDPAVEDAARPIDFLPAYAPGGMAFWRDSVTEAYLRLLDELYRSVDHGTLSPEEVMPLQDVFPIFWKRSARARWFYDRGWELLSR